VPGWRIVVLAPPGPLARECRAVGGAVLAEPFGPDYGVQCSVRTLRRAIHALRPDLVHTHLSYADIIAALAVIPSGPVLVSTEHGIAGDDRVYHGTRFKSRLMAEVHHARLARFHGLITVSGATTKTVETKWRPRHDLSIETILNGVDRTSLPIEHPRGLRIGAVSRLAPEKGLVDLIEAFARIHLDHPEARLTIAGVGPVDAELRGRTAAHGLTDIVGFPGFVDSAALLTQIDVMAQLSLWENCSYSLLDALRAGIGIVATDVGGNPELLPQHCLVAPGDVTAAAERIVQQALKPDRRPTLPPGWPSVPDMCAAISSFYGQVVR
jgi:glycogen(starch) synthase